ncbi:mediator of RNA polymerase II transcription subunit 20-like [Lineus longissimus]|uniref:mediator of RNA polymerase II transcription subunit 20-like n=1 Tax=Lineus longissimus TaxID=88925 RepID=UPI002B4DAA58
MGVVCVLQYPVPENKSGQQSVDLLQRLIEDLGATRTGTFCVDCETYQSTQTNPQRLVHVLHNTEQPASCFAVLDTGTGLVADILYDHLMLKLKGFYTARKNNRVECKGQRYVYGDFIIKVGSVNIGQNMSFKGILVELEYGPCVVPVDCWNLMKELLQGFMGNHAENLSIYLKGKMEQVYAPLDTMQQYLEHFNNFRKVSSGTVSR